MVKKVIAVFVLAVALVIASVITTGYLITGTANPVQWSRGEQTDTEHKHTFDTNKWVSDEVNHWHAATCGHGIIRDTAAHTYVNNVCKVCGYEKQAESETHVHTYDTSKWAGDEVNHWHAATCGHDIIRDIAAHTFTDDICTVCGYKKQAEPEKHVHTYDTGKWVGDEVNHWHAATCGHNIVKNMAVHTFENGACTVCGYKKQAEPETHVHTYNTSSWSYNKLNHWHEATCCNAIADIAEHTFVNGKCSVCGYRDKSIIVT